MTAQSTADLLDIGDGFVIWMIGNTVEEVALLDPLPEGASTLEVRDEIDPEPVDAALWFIEDIAELEDRLDEVMPMLGSVDVVWICIPARDLPELDGDAVADAVDDYGWEIFSSIDLEDWAAFRLYPA